MTEHWSELTRFGIGLFALLNPFTVLSFVLFSAAGAGSRGILVMAASTTATMIFILLAMHYMGEAVLVTLGTSLPSFQIGGGLIILLSGLSMLNEPPAASADGSPAIPSTAHLIKLGVAPLGVPMLAGAGAITKVIIESHPEYGIEEDILVGAIIVGVCLLSGAIIAASSVLVRILGPSFFSIVNRLSGLIIVAVAVEVMSKGVLAHARLFTAG